MNKQPMLQVPMHLPWPAPLIPKYRRGRYNNWAIEPTHALKRPTAGYFLPAIRQQPGWVITHRSKNVWMSLTAMEIESHMPHLAAARGHTVVAGLGMGFALFNVLQNPSVTKVTLLEKNPDIVSLMDAASDWRKWPNLNKLECIIGDALEWQAEEHVDFLYADIWPLLGDSSALSDTQRMQANIQADLVGYWGQELDFVEFDRARCFGNLPTYRLFARKSDLPLIEQNNPRYPKLCWAAATLQVGAAQKDPNIKMRIFLRYRDFLIGSLVDDQSVDPAYILEACKEVA